MKQKFRLFLPGYLKAQFRMDVSKDELERLARILLDLSRVP